MRSGKPLRTRDLVTRSDRKGRRANRSAGVQKPFRSRRSLARAFRFADPWSCRPVASGLEGQVWDLKHPEERTTMTGHRGAVRSVAFARDTLIVAGDDSGRVLLHKLDPPPEEVTDDAPGCRCPRCPPPYRVPAAAGPCVCPTPSRPWLVFSKWPWAWWPRSWGALPRLERCGFPRCHGDKVGVCRSVVASLSASSGGIGPRPLLPVASTQTSRPRLVTLDYPLCAPVVGCSGRS